jgi:hypothetical protein
LPLGKTPEDIVVDAYVSSVKGEGSEGKRVLPEKSYWRGVGRGLYSGSRTSRLEADLQPRAAVAAAAAAGGTE